MHILFIHQAFPAQFGRLGLELTKRYGFCCSFLIKDVSNCPLPDAEMLRSLERRRIPLPPDWDAARIVPWSQSYARHLDLARAVAEGVRSWQGLRPDLVVGHEGLGPTLFLPEVLDCPLVQYCEYYFARRQRDLTYRLDLPPADPSPFYPRCINAAALAGMLICRGGYTPTHWQRSTFPERFQSKIEVHFDGIDVEMYRPQRLPRAEVGRLLNGRSLGPDMRLVTFVARGLESMRGFDRFMDVADRIARQRPDVLFVVVGQENSFYGWDLLHTGVPSFKQWVLERGAYDLSRFVSLPHLEPAHLADLLSVSDLHLYLTVPFVPSWSLFNALACGCVVLASDVAPVREVIAPGVNGLLEPLFDTDRMAGTALRVLADPAAYRPLGQAGRKLMEEKYSLDVTVPALADYFQRMADEGVRAISRKV